MTTVELPEPGPTGDAKEATYCLRGETVAVGGAVDWTIRHLATAFARSEQPTTRRRWCDIKAHLKQRCLTDALQPELAAVAGYFRARELAAHGTAVVVQIGADTTILRLYFDGDQAKVERVALDDLAREAADARKGYRAVQAVGPGDAPE